MNELCIKIDSTKVTYFGNTQSKAGDLICQLLPVLMFDL